MTVGLDPQQVHNIEQERRRIGRLLDEVSRLCEADIPTINFYGELLKKLLEALNAPSGAIYLRSAQGNLQRIYQINLQDPNPDRDATAKQSHELLLHRAMMQPKPEHLMPNAYYGPAEEGQAAAGNPTQFVLMLVPILLEEKALGLIEVFQTNNRPLNAIPGFLQYIGLMADLATRFTRHQKVIQLTGQQQLWTQLEAFARQIHGSLNPSEVSYLIANEGRRLIDCDRLSLAARYGNNVRIEGMSGVDAIERRSNLVQLMQTLVKSVINWGEKLVFRGEKDDGLPPKVLDSLDAYLAESQSKLLVIQPLSDERDGKDADKKKPRAALIMESFDPPEDAEVLIERLEIVGRHSTSAIYNAVEHRRIPMRFIWGPLAALQDGLGGKTRAIVLASVVAATFLISVLCFWTYPLKMDAQGQILPAVRRWVYPTREGTVKDFHVNANEVVEQNLQLVSLFDPKLQEEIKTLRAKISTAANQEADAAKNASDVRGNSRDLARFLADKTKYKAEKDTAEAELQTKLKEFNADPLETQAGRFSLRAPTFTPRELALVRDPTWTVLNANFQDEWRGKNAKPTDPLLRLGAKSGPWEIELRIPQKHIGQVLSAYRDLKTDVLEVDYLLRSEPTRTFKGKLYRNNIASEANISHDEGHEQEPVILAYVKIFRDSDMDMPEQYRVPTELLVSGAEVHGKVRCGDKAAGYSLFYGVWEFFYEKVVFFF